MSERDPILDEFLVESYESLDELDQDLIELEKNPSNETMAKIFRAVHTIKGTSGFLALEKLESLTHVGENLLSKLRDGELEVTAENTTALLDLIDAVRAILGRIEETDAEGDEEYGELRDTLKRLLDPAEETAPEAEPAPEAEVETAPEVKAEPEAKPEPEGNAETEATQKADPAPAPVTENARVERPGKFGEALIAKGVSKQAIDDAIDAQDAGDRRHVGEILVERGVIRPQDVTEALERQQKSVSDSSLRVDVGILDDLMNMVGELVLARNQIVQFNESNQDPAFAAASQKLNHITTELQEQVMKTRMQPIGNVWNKFPRVVRDLARGCGKRVRIEMEGQDTEIDKTILEAIKDPLTHLVRNSVDHGLEEPDVRATAGKPEEGVVELRAYHEGGQVNIEIADDGAGIDVERLREKAIEKDLISSEQARGMSERELLNLIFAPGFSTAKTVTNVSGRGVGMDVVRTNIERIGGTIDLQSTRGAGTQIRIKIPLTLAIIPALIVSQGDARYAISQVSLLELVRLDGQQAERAVEMIHGAPVYRLRGRLLPLVYLQKELELGPEPETETDAINIVVLQADERRFGLVVHEVNDSQEIVVRPLGPELKGLSMFAGATVMGDGNVALILDVLGLAQRASVVTEGLEHSLGEADAELHAAQEDRQTMLLFRSPDDGRMAIPLSLVARLEEFSPDAIETAGAHEVVQYRGEIMPLVPVCDLLPERRSQRRNPTDAAESQSSDDAIQVVVYSEDGRSVGLVVGRILDIVEQALDVQEAAAREGVTGSVVIQDRVTELLDIQGIIRLANPYDTPSFGAEA